MMNRKSMNLSTQDTDIKDIELEEHSSHGKGEMFEKEFANFMKKSLGYEKTVNRRNVSSAENGRGTNVDVIGFKTDPRGKRLRILGIIYIAAALLTIIIKAIYTSGNQMNDAALSTVIFVFSVVLLGFGSFTVYKSKTLENENAWVECKNLKTKATYNHLTIMYEQFRNYEKSNDSKYKFTELYFVSANGFVDNAIEFAKQKNIRCYVEDSNKKFIEIQF